MTSLDKLFIELDKDRNIKRLHELEASFDKNEEIKKLITRKQEVSKNMINSKLAHLTNNYNELKKEYDSIYEKFKEIPNLDEYLDLLDYYNGQLSSIIYYLENKINESLK